MQYWTVQVQVNPLQPPVGPQVTGTCNPCLGSLLPQCLFSLDVVPSLFSLNVQPVKVHSPLMSLRNVIAILWENLWFLVLETQLNQLKKLGLMLEIQLEKLGSSGWWLRFN